MISFIDFDDSYTKLLNFHRNQHESILKILFDRHGGKTELVSTLKIPEILKL
jgi:hypothetical protein